MNNLLNCPDGCVQKSQIPDLVAPWLVASGSVARPQPNTTDLHAGRAWLVIVAGAAPFPVIPPELRINPLARLILSSLLTGLDQA